MTSPVTAHPSLLQHTGLWYFPVAFVARLPFAMMTVGVLALVAGYRGSVALGGLTSAAVGIGVVVAGPVLGDLVDRFGQRRVLVPVGLANGILLAVFPLAVAAPVADAMLLAAATAIGLTGPQTAAMSRARVIALIGLRVHPERREHTFSRVMAYESAADETAFVIGPFVVGVLAALVAPWAPIAGAALLSLVFVTAFALHPTGRAVPSRRAHGAMAPFREVLHPRLLVLVGAALGVGAFFGTTLTSLTAFMNERGAPEAGALLYGVMGVGSAVLALGMALLPAGFVLRWRLVTFAVLLTASAGAYTVGGSVPTVTLVLCLMGIGIGPSLVTLLSLAGTRAPRGRTASTMTLLGSALTLAQALSSAVAGAVAEQVSVAAAMALPAAAALVVLAMASMNALNAPRWDAVRPAAGTALAG
ncbi:MULTISPECIES: MFS transporter [Microbacterium]|uniref:MFS transporter n=1 Tax=Microbacterium TaxID=33882 RepID=UPI0027807AD6|nr:MULTISPECIES: MFS transporter [Microbacterium]MDQ1083674.1 MFS family permease [Microbacterium sp. SORGH_AS_0344]MDQ1171049.1 MFS family permease [Microbacterium proteolyticum]